MKTLASLLAGAATGVAAVFLHLFLPPFGLALAVLGTFAAIWAVGRRYGKRRYKFYALVAWLVVIARAGSFGAGNELLIQGDNPGSALLMIGFLAGLIAVMPRP